MPGISAAILAGGGSTRMGRDKAMLAIGGCTLLTRLARLTLTLALPTAVIGRRRPADWTLPGVAFLADDEPGAGPFAAIRTALRRAPGDVIVLACDLPGLDQPTLRWLLTAAEAAPGRCVAAVVAERIQPLLAVWRRSALPALDAAAAGGERSPRRWLVAAGAAMPDLPAFLAPAAEDCDTPEAWARVVGAA